MTACNPVLARPDAPQVTFERHEVVTGSAKHQTVLTGFLLGGPVADLAVVNVDENNDRRLRIYALREGTWTPELDAVLGAEVWFVDVANIGGRDRLITYRNGRLNWFDPNSETERALVEVPSDLKPPPPGPIPHVDVTRDLNGDQRDDLVVPGSEGFQVFIQRTDGTFADPVQIGPASDLTRIYEGDGYRCNPWVHSRVHEIDYNRDGRSDLVFWNQDHFEVHLQDEQGRFAEVAENSTTEVAFDSDDLASLAAPYGVRRRRMDHNPSGSLTGRVLHSLRDMNGDGIADLVVFWLKGGGLWSMNSSYEVHFGSPASDGGTEFAPDAGTVIDADGIPFGIEPRDFDRDGQIDLMYTVIDPGILKAFGMIIGALLTKSVSMDLKFYCLEGGVYPKRPTVSRKIKTYPGGSGERTAYSAVLIGDVNGDGRSDLILGSRRNGLRVFLGEPRPVLFSRQSQRIAKGSRSLQEYTWLADLNQDGKQDILMHHPSTSAPRRVTLLMAR